MIVLYSTKVPYRMMVEKGVEDIRAVYYNRKIVHVFAGGLDRFVFRIFHRLLVPHGLWNNPHHIHIHRSYFRPENVLVPNGTESERCQILPDVVGLNNGDMGTCW